MYCYWGEGHGPCSPGSATAGTVQPAFPTASTIAAVSTTTTASPAASPVTLLSAESIQIPKTLNPNATTCFISGNDDRWVYLHFFLSFSMRVMKSFLHACAERSIWVELLLWSIFKLQSGNGTTPVGIGKWHQCPPWSLHGWDYGFMRIKSTIYPINCTPAALLR